MLLANILPWRHLGHLACKAALKALLMGAGGFYLKLNIFMMLCVVNLFFLKSSGVKAGMLFKKFSEVGIIGKVEPVYAISVILSSRLISRRLASNTPGYGSPRRQAIPKISLHISRLSGWV
jgi:hypothetical protein